MTALWTSREAAEATGGLPVGDWQASGVSIDTRSLQKGDLFVALKDVRDGHDFVAQALKNGAAAALVSRVPDGVGDAAPLLIVDDVLAALRALGRAGRARTGAKVIAVTGSVGKTSTKEMLRAVLERQGRVHAAEKSFNNHWGVPLTLARMPRDADFAVIEIGMNHPGEIAPLAKLTAPDVAVVTTIAPAHLEAFADLAGIAREKAAIFDGMGRSGIAIINADLETTPILVEKARETGLTPLLFGQSKSAGFRILDLRLAHDVTVVRAEIGGDTLLLKIHSAGRHFAMNALAVLAATRALGADPALAALDIARWRPPAGRGTRETLQLDEVEIEHTIDLIDDAYNANPISMNAALEMLALAAPTDNIGRIAKGRRIAILGDMLELGPQELTFHAALADHPAIPAIDLIHCVGPRMRALFDALPDSKRGQWVEKSEELAAQAHSLVDAGDVILVKGSLGSQVSLIVQAIRKLGQSAPQKM